MGCTNSKEKLKVAPDGSECIDKRSADKDQETTMISPIQKEIQTVEKTTAKIKKPVLPSIKKPPGVAFEILLDDTEASPIPLPKGAPSKLVLPKIRPKTSNEEISKDAREIKERLLEKEAQAAKNRELEMEKKQQKVAERDERARQVLDRKNMNEINDSKNSMNREEE